MFLDIIFDSVFASGLESLYRINRSLDQSFSSTIFGLKIFVLMAEELEQGWDRGEAELSRISIGFCCLGRVWHSFGSLAHKLSRVP